MKKVIIITGPGGVGKSTIAELLKKECGYVLLDGDNEDTEFSPNGGQWSSENSENLKKAHNKILKKTEELVKQGKKVVVDYIIFGYYSDFLNKFRETFGNDLQITILFPNQSEIIIRDKERECWTTGEERIKKVCFELEKIKNEVGEENYIDTSNQTPEETFEKYFKC